MFARLTTGQVKNDKLDEFLMVYRESIVLAAKPQEGVGGDGEGEGGVRQVRLTHRSTLAPITRDLSKHVITTRYGSELSQRHCTRPAYVC